MSARAFAIWSVVAISIAAACSPAIAQSYSAGGQAGYLGEWEIKGDLTRTVTRAGVRYDGPVTLRHVGLCSANGVEEKTGMVQLRIRPKATDFDGNLALQDDDCRISASAGQPYTGLLSCRDGNGIPIHLTIEPMQVADRAASPAAK